MKKSITIIAILSLLSTFTFAQNVFFADSNFKSILLINSAINTNADLEIQQTEAAAYTGALYVNNSGLTDLTGIEAFTNLTLLSCYSNQLSSLDVSQNTSLLSLDCSYNQLTSLIANNSSLITINCNSNKLSSLDVSQNSNLNSLYANDNLLTSLTLSNATLIYLACYNNKLRSLTTTGCTQLANLDCSYNLLTSIDVSQSPNLNFLYVSNNQLSSINVSSNLLLASIKCGNNQILNLNLSSNAILTDLACEYNQIHYLDLSNNHYLNGLICNNNELTSLNIQNGNNINLGSNDVTFDTRNNSGLTCILVDDTAIMNSVWSDRKDAGANYAIYCLPCTVYIPDLNFKSALLANTSINLDGNGEIECSEALAYNGFIFVNSLNISDVTGIEAFTSISNFSCNTNQISKLNLGANTSLQYVNCSFNQINNLKLPASSNLLELSCFNNQLSKIDVTNCANINFLDCNQNSISTIDISNAASLNYFYCDNNTVDALDLSNNHALLQFSCNFNALNYLNLKNGNNLNMTSFSAYGNPNLSCIQVDDTTWATANWTGNIDASASFHTTCPACVVYIPDSNFKAILLANTALNTNGNNEIECTEAAAYTGSIDIGSGFNPNITDLTGLEKFTAITYLDCSYNDLTTLDVSANTALTTLYATDNLLTTIDISANTALVNLNLSNNYFSNVNTSNNHALQFIHLANNQLTSIDVTQNSSLTELILRDNQLSSIDVSQNYALQGLSLYNNKLTSLNVSANYSLTWYLYCEHNQLYTLDLRNGANFLLSNFSAYDNPLLTCILVDDTTWAIANWTPYVDATASFEIYCPACVVYIPDVNFKSALLADPFINLNGNAEIECSEALAFNGLLNVNSASINDLTGIESFLNISGLFCNNNQLTSLDLSNNKKLNTVRCMYNSISNLILPQGDSLHTLVCAFNQLSNLDLSTVYGLNYLECNGNLFTSLYLNQNSKLQELYCFNNQLTSLDLSGNPEIAALLCYNNQLTSLNLNGASNLFNLECQGNLLPYLDLSSCSALNTLDCSGNQISNLYFTNSIVGFYCGNNLISSLDLSANTGLASLDCNSNQLSSLNIQNGNNHSLSPFNATNNPLLSCIQVDDTAYMNSSWNSGKDAGAYFSYNCSCILPASAGIITGANSVAACINQLGIVYSIDTIARATSYTWTLPPLASIISNPDSNVVIVDYDAYSTSGNVTVVGTNSCGNGPSATLPVTFKPIPVVEICRATIDSVTQKTIIEWQKPSETYVNGYAIYRDSAGVYKKLDIVSNTLFSSFLDTGSYPSLRAEKYKIAVYDSCGNIGDISSPFSHETINLHGSIQPGGVTKLYWNDYVGINDPLRYFNLLRDPSGSGPFTDTLLKNLSPQAYMLYTDMGAVGLPLCRYVVEMVYESNCIPSQRLMLNKSTSRSNIKNRFALIDSSTVGLQNNFEANSGFTIYPNPFNSSAQLEYILSNNSDVQITLSNALGIKIQTLLTAKQSGGKYKLNMDSKSLQLQPGVYLVTLNINGIRQSKPLVLIE